MSDAPETPPPPRGQSRGVGTGLAGETTRGADSAPRFESERPLEVIGDFEVIGKLGQGGMGAVYRARQVTLDRQVALKILPAQMEHDAEFVNRFQREGRIAASLSHPNLVRVYTTGFAGGCHFIAMELIEGETLGQWLKRGVLPFTEALRIALDVARALECGWQRAQLIHRDIKPGNIFLSQDGAVKLGDLGLAKTLGGDTTGLTQTGMAMGTPHYISPEQARGDRDIDFRADIYSLGCTLYQMLTGRTPYSGTDPVAIFHHHLHSPPPAILKVLPQCPLPLARLLAKMLKKQRRERFAGYEELIAALESVRAQLDPGLAAPTEGMVGPRGRRGIEGDGGRASQAPRLPGEGIGDQATLLRETPAPSGSTEVGTPRRGVLSEASLTDVGEGRRGAPTLSTKTKAPLYGGIAAGLLLLGIVGWLFWPKEEKLTKAQIYAREHAAVAGVNDPGAEQGRGSPVNQPPLVPSATSAGARPSDPRSGLSEAATAAVTPPAAEPWQDVLHDPAKLDLSSKVERTPEGLRFTDVGPALVRPGQGPQRDGAVRMRAAFGGLRPQLRARSTPNVGIYELQAKNEKLVTLGRYDSAAKLRTNIRDFPLEKPLQPGQDYELELRVVGQLLTAKLNGVILGTATDSTYSQGQFGMMIAARDADSVVIKSLEVLDLAAPGGPGVAAAAASKEESWQPLFTEKEWQAEHHVKRESNGKTVSELREFHDGLLHVQSHHFWKPQSSADGAIRARLVMRDESRLVGVSARHSNSQGFYKLATASDGKSVWLNYFGAGGVASGLLGKYELPAPLRPGDKLLLELRAEGTHLTGLVNGTAVIDVLDDHLKAAGEWGITATDGWFESAEILDLGAAGGADGVIGGQAPRLPGGESPQPQRASGALALQAATKEAPFVNTLGMKFVPVRVTGGPTGGQRVLFSIWETRVQDYEVFVKETKRPWPKPPFEQDEAHPAVQVSWEDAQAFCAWLTERERKSAPSSEWVYRLPTDREWSCAVGIGALEDMAKTAEENAKATGGIYPWGKTWPPPTGTGNFNGEEADGHQIDKSQHILAGYRDPFPHTSPVGSFPANPTGIYDLEANVREWCEDSAGRGPDERAIRGGTFALGDSGFFQSRTRTGAKTDYRSWWLGFRVVLAPVR